MENEFKVGDKVILFDTRHVYGTKAWALSKIRTVHKIYKTGHFVLEHAGIRYRKDGYQTGDWSTEHVQHATPERLEKRNLAIKTYKVRDKIAELGKRLQYVSIDDAVHVRSLIQDELFEYFEIEN
jgi:hypothetical protein